MSVEKMLDYFMIANGKECEKKVKIFEKMTILWLQMVKNVIKGSFPISKVLVFEGNSYVCWKNEDIRLFYDCTW